jgi:hypothetical protein
MSRIRLPSIVALALGCSVAVAIDHKSAGPPLGPGFADGLSPACKPFYSPDWQPVDGADAQRPASLPKPARGKPFADAEYKTCIVRVTDHAADQVPGYARNDYSRRQGFNADNSKIVVAAQDGSWHWYDVATRRYGGKLPDLGGDAEPQWHPTKPNILYYSPPFGIGMQIRELDVTTGKMRVAADLAKRITALWPTANSAWTKAEGSPSRDARYWALMVDDAKWNGLGLITYDLESDKILASYDFAKHKKGRPDHVSMSPSGTYLVVSWDEGPVAFTRDFANERKLAHKGEHSDLALDDKGDDTYVSIDYEARGGPVYMLNLRTGVRTELFSTYIEHTATAIHFSGRAFSKPGWVLASTYGDYGGAWQWLHGKVFAFELKPHPRVVNLANHHVVYNEYFTEPHASVNRDFTRVVFGSNWETGSKTDIDTYMIELPKGVTAPRP